MSNLPPYSTFRTDSKQMMYPQATSHGNILNFTPPGFQHSLNVKFPDSRLPVCEKCKKNFKTRDMCRVRNAHATAPWTTAYICVTLDDTCTDENGKYIDKPMTVRMVQWQPYCVKTPFESKTPVCAACKKTNRTRSFCRERHKHRQLPWCTVYVLLSALDRADPNSVVAAPSTLVKSESGGSATGTESTPAKLGGGVKTTDAAQGTPAANASFDSTATTVPTSDESERKKSGDENGDNINDIAESRTFLAKVSGKSTTIHWLDHPEYDANDPTFHVGYAGAEASAPVAATMPANPAMADPNQYYYAHQHQLKSHQQYFFQMQQRNQQPYTWSGQPYPGPPQEMPPLDDQENPSHHSHQVQSQNPQTAALQPVQPKPPQADAQRGPGGEASETPSLTAGEMAAQRRRKRQGTQPSASESAGSPENGSQQQEQPKQHALRQHPPQQQQWAAYQPQMYGHHPLAPAPPQHGVSQHGGQPQQHTPPHVHGYYAAHYQPMQGGQPSPPPNHGSPADARSQQYQHLSPAQHLQQQRTHTSNPPTEQSEAAETERPMTAGEMAAKRRRLNK